ncbi:MAG: arylsulfatase [Gemmatimonadetes bacterium]|nr:arylsulfatase [Gemmatimonadota bacterium]
MPPPLGHPTVLSSDHPRPAPRRSVRASAAGALRLSLAAACLTLAACDERGDGTEEDLGPNILLLVADDLAYADLGSYGGDVHTPNIDALAARGVRFSQFHTAPMCAPTRAMLLSGNDNHVAGMGWQGGAPAELASNPGYESHLSDRIVPFPQLLQDAGYRTYSVGKWHLGTAADHTPTAAGFERSFQLLQGAGDHYSSVALEPQDSVSTYWADGDFTTWPEGSYSTEVYTDRLLEFIEEDRGDGRPFFAFAAYTSPHWPLQVPDDYLDLYRGQYDMRYDRLRELRFESLQEAGIVSADHELPPRLDWIKPWEDLSAEQQRIESRKMELYAAMVQNLDEHVGRLIGALEAVGELENTVVVFMSDNGAAAEDFYNAGAFAEWLQGRYVDDFEFMGTPQSYVSYGPQWAEAGSAPYRGHKTYAHEGGIIAPLIVAGPGVDREPNESDFGRIERAWVGVADIAPTILELAGVGYPGSRGTTDTQPMSGTSMLPLLEGSADRIHPPDELLALSHRMHAYVRLGDWKLVSSDQYQGTGTFELFDLASDPGETVDVSERFPEKRTELMDSLEAFRARVGVVIPEGG